MQDQSRKYSLMRGMGYESLKVALARRFTLEKHWPGWGGARNLPNVLHSGATEADGLGNADFSFTEGGCVIDAVAGHGNVSTLREIARLGHDKRVTFHTP